MLKSKWNKKLRQKVKLMYKRHIFVLNDYCTWNDFKSKTQHNKIKVKKEVIHNFFTTFCYFVPKIRVWVHNFIRARKKNIFHRKLYGRVEHSFACKILRWSWKFVDDENQIGITMKVNLGCFHLVDKIYYCWRNSSALQWLVNLQNPLIF